MTDKLDELVKAGEAKRHAAVEAAANAKDAQLLSARRATSAFGVMAASEWWFIVGVICFVAVLLAVIGLGTPPHEHHNHIYPNNQLPVALGFVAFACALAGVTLIARQLVRRAYQQELAWLASLPFPIERHLTLIASERGTFKLEFVGSAPDRTLLAKLLAGLSWRLEVENDKAPFMIEVRSARQTSPRGMWRVWRMIVRDLLLPLHEQYPIARVSFQ